MYPFHTLSYPTRVGLKIILEILRLRIIFGVFPCPRCSPFALVDSNIDYSICM